jgi:competence protein ComEC
MVAMLAALFAYIAVVEQRPPVLRAGLMTAIVVAGSFFYRRAEVLNSAALAALILLIAKPQAAADGSFQLSFLAIGCIAGVAVPWIERHLQPYARALRGWRDVTRDGGNDAVRAQFRPDVRAACAALTRGLPERVARWSGDAGVRCFGGTLRAAEMFVVSVVLQIGMLPLMARDFHRIPLLGAVVNLLVVPLTGVIVPLGFIGLGSSLVLRGLGRMVAVPLAWLVGIQDAIVAAFARVSLGSYRIPAPPVWVMVLFFCGERGAGGEFSNDSGVAKMGFRRGHCGDCVRGSDDRDISVSAVDGARCAGDDGAGCGAGRRDPGGVAAREHAADRWRRRVQGIQRPRRASGA